MSRPRLQVRYAQASRRGPLHVENEDACCVAASGQPQLFAVADGVSASEAGVVASGISCERLLQFMDETPLAQVEGLLQTIREIDWELRGLSQHAATTLSALWVQGERGVVVRVGDSPVLLLRGGESYYLGVDETSIRRRRLGAYVGMGEGLDGAMQVESLSLRPGDVLVLATDGVGDLGDDTISDTWLRAPDPESMVHDLLDQVARSGEQDDATVIVVEVRVDPAGALELPLRDAPDPPGHLVDSLNS